MNSNLSRGAANLLKILRRYMGRKWKCWPKQATLANELRASLRAIQYWLHELVKSGYIIARRVAAKCGQNEYVLAGQIELFSQSQVAQNLRVTHAKDVCKQQKLEDLKKPFKESCTNVHEIESIRATPPRKPNRAVTDHYIQAQTESIRTAVRAIGMEPTPRLMTILDRKRAFYGATGFQVASAIDQAFRRVQSSPSVRPQGPGWIVAVVENELKKRKPAASRPVGDVVPLNSGEGDGAWLPTGLLAKQERHGARGHPTTPQADGYKTAPASPTIKKTFTATRMPPEVEDWDVGAFRSQIAAAAMKLSMAR